MESHTRNKAVQSEQWPPKLINNHTESHDHKNDQPVEPDAQIFEDNDQCLIDNPLAHLNSHEIEDKAKQFVRDHDLVQQEEIFVKAGKILRDPEAWKSVPFLTEEEKCCLETEIQNGFWAQPKGLKVTIITLCVAAVVQGWNQTASNGANLNWPEQLGLEVAGCDPKGRDAWIFAIVNAAPYLSAAFCGAWIADPLNEYFLGRRPAICISALLILASMIGSACSQTWEQLLACRVVLGIGMGTKASTVPIFAAEVAPTHIRGSLVMNWQLFDALGIFLGFTANLIVSGVGATAWRWQTASSVYPTIILLALIFVASDSPRFLMKRGRSRYIVAYSNLITLRGHPILAAKELFYTHCQMEVEKRFISGKATEAEILNQEESVVEEAKGKLTSRAVTEARSRSARSINYWQKLSQLFTNKRIRRAMVAAVVVMISQQLCGVNVLAVYSSTLYCDSSDQQNGNVTDPSFLEPLFLSWGIGLTNFLFAFPAYFLIDKRGRRWLLLIALPFMALSMLAASLSYQIPSSSDAHAPVIGIFTYIFMIFYSFSMGPVPFTMSAEVFPLENRVVGMSFAVFTNMLGFGLLVLFVPIITANVGHPGLLGIFAGLNVVAFLLIFFFVRETAGATVGRTSMTSLSLEELNYVFGVSTRKHAVYQTKTVLPWVWRRYVKRDKNCPDSPEQLYTWANARRAAREEQEDGIDT